MAVDPRGIVARSERLLRRMENQQVAAMSRVLRRAQADLEKELKALYIKAQQEGMTESIAWRTTRARMMLEDVNKAVAKFDLSTNPTASRALRKTIREARKIGRDSATELIDAFDPSRRNLGMVNAGVVDISLESLADAVANSAARLYRYSAELQLQINDIVLSGLSRGQGWAKTAKELRRATGMLDYQAERIVRTESLSNNDNARRKVYQEEGIQYVQRLATEDTRVCEYCAARAGNVYRVDEAPAALHPNDRCYNVPWDPGWHAAGLTDDGVMEDHRRDVEQKLKDEGKEPNHGKAPFERMNDLERPKPVWIPGSGFTVEGKAQGLA